MSIKDEPEFKRLMLLSVSHFFGNLILLITLFMIIFLPNSIINYRVTLLPIFMIIFLLYYFSLALFSLHYAPLIKNFTKKKKDLFIWIAWFIGFIILFIILWKATDRKTTLVAFLGLIAYFILDRAINSFKYWKDKRKANKKPA